MRRTGLPEGHVCQSQETGAQVGGSFSAKVRGRLCLCLQVPVLRRFLYGQYRHFCGDGVNRCWLKAFQCLVGELLIKLSNGVRVCHESGMM